MRTTPVPLPIRRTCRGGPRPGRPSPASALPSRPGQAAPGRRTIRVLVADARPTVRDGLALLLEMEQDIAVVAHSDGGPHLVGLVHRHRPDVVVTGQQAVWLRSFAGAGCRLPVLAITSGHSLAEVYTAVRAGVTGFVRRERVPQALVSAVRAVADGDAWLDPTIARAVVQDVASRAAVIQDAASAVAGDAPDADLGVLTARERQILAMAAQGMTNQDIAGTLVISERTVRTHVSRVLCKLGTHTRAQAVVAAYRAGLVRVQVPAA